MAVPLIAGAVVVADRRRYRRPAFAFVATLAAVGESAWVVRRSAARDGWEDRGIALAETGFGVIGELLETLADPQFTAIDARPLDQYIQFLAASAAIANPTRRGAAASVLAIAASSVLTAAVPGRSSLPLGSASSLGLGVSFFTNTGALRVFWELLVTNADALDRARAERVHQGARLAREQERASQQRIAHDSALQVLEAIAGGWDIDEERLLERIGVELDQLRAMLAGDRESGDLASAVADVMVRAGADGVRVDLELADDVRTVTGDAVGALAAAIGEALTNVRKHSGVLHAEVAVWAEPGRILARVSDAGRGFDPGSGGPGFGLTNSIHGRLGAVGGSATIRSVPGHGATVEMWVPR
jgi:signal transduction histidine kinase